MADGLERAVEWLLARQSPEGWWSGELETNVTMTAEHVLLMGFLGIGLDEIRERAARHILGEQRSDGSWALYYDGPADLSTTIEAYVALKVLGLATDDGAMRKALATIVRLGGLTRARVFTKIWMALFGVYPWKGVPSLPPEIVWLPPSIPFNLYDFSCWARGTIAPLTIVVSRRPTRRLGINVDEIFVAGSEHEREIVPGTGWMWWLDKALKIYDALKIHPGRDQAIRRTAEWIVERQELDGSWGGIQPPWVYSLIALSVEGFALDHPVMRKGLAGMERFVLDDERGWRFQACMSPVWDTAWAIRALRWAGLSREHPALRRAVSWMLAEQIAPDQPGDWQVKCKGVPCGGWAFEFDNDIYPDIDDTAVIVCALLEGGEGEAVQASIERARDWVVAMRSSNGAWGAFDRDNTRELVYRMPFADFGALIDPPTEDVTAHVLEMLGALGWETSETIVTRGLEYLRETQKGTGSWFGRWGVNHVYGTWCVISALVTLRTGDAMIERATRWLLSVQNPDGGWGESCHSYVDESFAGVGVSTPSQTAWAVNALQLAGLGRNPAVQRGVALLRTLQRPDGTWDEPHYTGTGFPRDFYINYHLYRHLFPLTALAFDRALAEAPAREGGRSETSTEKVPT